MQPVSLPAWLVSLCTVVLLVAVYNQPLWNFIGGKDASGHVAPYASLVIGGIYLLVISLLAVPYLHKAVIGTLLLLSSIIMPMMKEYGVLIDVGMVRNAAETDWHETRDLVTWSGVLWLLVGGVLPLFVLYKLRVVYPGRTFRGLVRYVVPPFVGLAVVVTGGWLGMRDLAPFFRNHREARHIIVPYNAIAAMVKYAREQPAAQANESFTPSAATKLSWPTDGAQRRVIVFVLGETARARNFSLGGYARQTNPRLAARDIAYFGDFSSCGTSTADSVPCIFSVLGRKDFTAAKLAANDTLLDQVRAAGFKTLWIDNNSGCKKACRKDETIDMKALKARYPELCPDGECLDAVLARALERALAENEGDLFIVLHQKGSHGPLYYKRYPAEAASFKPFCANASLNECDREEVVNAYDNSILYTDWLLDEVVRLLETQRYAATAMFYVSDHGESLGENGLYLHGAPYMIAPAEQTHVPAVLWLSETYRAATGIDAGCVGRLVQQRFSHDNVFATMLQLSGVDSTAPIKHPSMLQACSKVPAG